MTPRLNWRASLAFFHDACMAAIAWVGIYWLRFNLELREPFATDMLFTLAWVLPLQAAIFLALGLYRGLWRFASLLDLQRIVVAAGLGAILIPLVLVMLQLQAVVPRSVLFFYPIVLIFLMAGIRFAFRHLEGAPAVQPVRSARRAGARRRRRRGGCAAHQRDRAQPAMARRRPARRRPRPSTAGCCATSACWGRSPSLTVWVRRYGVRKVIIALPSANHGVRRRVAELCAARGRRGADRAVVRGPDQSGARALTTMRTVELDDLLGRDPVVLDNAGLARMARQPRRDGDRRGRLDRRRALPADRAVSPGAARAVRDLRGSAVRDPDCARRRVSAARRRAVVGDVKHASIVEDVLAREKPDVIFHAAAYKHVPLMEETNAWQAVRNNALRHVGARARGRAAEGREVRARVHRQGGQPD